ncbi:MAG TPA: two-component regulator propeller domain-containing protein [Fulvivirga sp.]|nr:two-component regulator propeller domain-containing protein [Fulvivirga sp.]
MRLNIFISPILYFGLLITGFTANGQAYNFVNYGIGEGLAHENVVDICEDQFGNIWLATAGGGLSKFNGLEFSNFTIKDGLPSNYIRKVICDRKGNLWIASAKGITRFDGKTVINFVPDSLDESNNSINALHESHDGTIWFAGAQGGLGKIDTLQNLTFEEVPGLFGNDKIIAIDEDSQGNIWFISAIHGLFKHYNGQYLNIISNADFKGYLLSLYIDKTDNLWMGSNKGLVRFKEQDYQSIGDLKITLDQTFIKSAKVYDENEIWIISASGALKYEPEKTYSFGASQGLTNSGINVIYNDREGNIWFGSDSDGLYKLINESFVFYGKQHGLNVLPVTSIVEDKNQNFWFGSFGSGLERLGNGNFENYGLSEHLSSMYISASACDSSGNLWFGTRGSGLMKYDPTTAQSDGNDFKYITSKDGLIYDFIRQLFIDSENNLWVGTPSGISKYDGVNFENYNTSNGLMDNIIWDISEPTPGQVLIVTRAGFNIYQNNKLSKVDLNPEIFKKRINTAKRDREGNYWIGYSGHGLLKINQNGDQEFITVDQGLTSDLIYNLLFDKDQNLLVGSERGLDKIILDSQRNIKRIKNFGQTEGFKNLQTAYNVTFQDTNGCVWFGVDDGVFRYDPGKEKLNQTEPLTYISGVKLFYNEVDWSQYAEHVTSWLNIPSGIQLPHSENNLIFEYFGASMRNPQDVKYRFRLVGLENQWSPVTSRREAIYTNLSPGIYTFEVLAANSDGIWNKEPTQLEFEIIPPFWQRPWFYAVLTILILGALKLYNDYKVRSNLNKILTVERIRSEELLKVRKRMARDFHDNMGNQLASITVFTNLINLKLKDKSREIDELLKNIQKHTKSLFTGTKDFIWSMDPDSDNLAEIFTYIKDFGEELFDKTDLIFYSKSDDFKKEYPLPSGWSRQLVLIFKEAMTNVLKHSCASEVYFELNLKDSEFVISLIDNGKGLDNELVGKGMGLKNMQSRAKQINGELDISTGVDGKGTKIIYKGTIQSEPNKKDKLI